MESKRKNYTTSLTFNTAKMHTHMHRATEIALFLMHVFDYIPTDKHTGIFNTAFKRFGNNSDICLHSSHSDLECTNTSQNCVMWHVIKRTDDLTMTTTQKNSKKY